LAQSIPISSSLILGPKRLLGGFHLPSAQNACLKKYGRRDTNGNLGKTVTTAKTGVKEIDYPDYRKIQEQEMVVYIG
jgi:hypothetical protein